MLKFKVTDRELAREPFVFWVDYCKLEGLLKDLRPIAYSKGRLGWRYDVYKIRDVYIATGYHRPRARCIPFPEQLRKKYVEEFAGLWERGKVPCIQVLGLAAELEEFAIAYNRVKRDGTK